MPRPKKEKLVNIGEAAKTEVLAAPEPVVEVSKLEEETKMIGAKKYRVIRDLVAGTTRLELIG